MSAKLAVSRDYFHMALNGRFSPPSDPKRRKHTLARLMGATMERGEVTDPGSDQEKRIYVPSWAPIKSSVLVIFSDVHSLTLTGEEREVQFVHTMQEGSPGGIQVLDTDYSDLLVFKAQLGHAPDHERIQKRIRNIAQNFFEAFPAPEIIHTA